MFVCIYMSRDMYETFVWQKKVKLKRYIWKRKRELQGNGRTKR